MEEKERYRPRFENCIEDNTTQITYCVNHRFVICNLLNQQDKRIKELEEVRKDFISLVSELTPFRYRNEFLTEQIQELKQENQQLKQQLHDLPNSILREIKARQPNFTENSYGVTTKQGWDMCVEILETIWKSYGGEI